MENAFPGRVGSVFVEINTNSAKLELGLWLSLAIALTKSVYIALFGHTVATSVCNIEENE